MVFLQLCSLPGVEDDRSQQAAGPQFVEEVMSHIIILYQFNQSIAQIIAEKLKLFILKRAIIYATGSLLRE